jgi:hypothetical protein
MGNGRLNSRDRLFIRLAKDGTVVADSAMWRKHIPRGQGRWKDITEAVLTCCSTTIPTVRSYMVFRNTTASANITAISFPGYSWTGTLANGQYLVVELPYDFNETISITVDTPSGRTITTSTVQGTGTIAAIGAITAATNTTTVTPDPDSQYLVILS